MLRSCPEATVQILWSRNRWILWNNTILTLKSIYQPLSYLLKKNGVPDKNLNSWWTNNHESFYENFYWFRDLKTVLIFIFKRSFMVYQEKQGSHWKFKNTKSSKNFSEGLLQKLFQISRRIFFLYFSFKILKMFFMKNC